MSPLAAADTDTSQLDMKRLEQEFPYYCANLLYIRTDDRRFVKFSQWYPTQWKVWQSIEKDLRAGRPIRKIILKARQHGISTLTEAFIFWQIATRPNTYSLVLSMDRDSTSKIFEMARNFYECLPLEMRPMKRYSSKKELVLENPDEKTRPRNPGMRSSIEVQTASRYTPPRGANFNLVHFSEVAFWPNAEEILPAIVPMVHYKPETCIIYESTANGKSNFFYEEWMAAKEGDSAYDPIFIPWFTRPDYRIPLYSQVHLREMLSDLDDEEDELIGRFGLLPEQLNWRRWKIKELGGDIDRFHQEYPSTDIEAFTYSGDPIFNRSILKRIETRDPLHTAAIKSDRVVPDSSGDLNVWEDPIPGSSYVIGVDVSSGETRDASCMCVLRNTFPKGLAEQAAEYHGRPDPVTLGRLAVVLARHYNNAVLSIELNNHGLTTQVEAQRDYWNFYRWKYFDRVQRAYTDKVGWVTSVSTKPILVDRTRSCLQDGLVGINSRMLLEEMWDYIKVPDTMTFEAESGNDDRVMAFMIALVTMYIDDPNVHLGQTSETRSSISVPAVTTYVSRCNDPSDPRGGLVVSEPDWRTL